MSGKRSKFGCVATVSVEEKIEVILDQGSNENGYVQSLTERLVLHVTGAIHGVHNCSTYQKELETLCVVLKVQFHSHHNCNKINSRNVNFDSVIELCLDMLRNIEDGKDTCLPIVCDILYYSFCLLPSDIHADKIVSIMINSKSQVMELTELLSSVCLDSEYMLLEVNRVGINLRLWETMITILLASENNCNMTVVRPDLLQIFDSKLIELLIKVVNFEHNVLSSQVLLCVIPKFVILTKSGSVIKQLWENIVVQFNSGEYIKHVSPHMYLILCTLSDLFIPCRKSLIFSYPVLENGDFWRILQYGIVSSDALMRKQGLYLLKRSVESHVHLNTYDTSNVFWWNDQKTSQYEKVWNNVFLMLEVLEEKQMHLVEPVQPVLDTLVGACHKGIIHSSWVFCVVQRALGHDCSAVVKWGIIAFSELELFKFMALGMDYNFIFSSLIPALNTASLYGMIAGTSTSVPKITSEFKSFLIAVVDNQKDLCSIFTSLLNSLVQVSWGPVALFHVVYALAAVPKCPVWNIDSINVLKSFLIDALATQVVHIRGAIQTYFIDTLINFADEQQLDVKTIAHFFGSFRKKETLKRGTYTWCKVVTWLKSFIKQEDAMNFAQESFSRVIKGNLECETQAVARMIILLSDAELIDLNIKNPSCKCSSLCSVLQYFENCSERMYICPIKQNACLDILISLLEECQPIGDTDCTGQCIVVLISSVVPGIFYSIKKNMFAAHNLTYFDTVCLYLRALNLLSMAPKLRSIILTYSNVIQDCSFSIMREDNPTPVSKFFAIKVISWITNLIKLISTQRPISFYDNSKLLSAQQLSFLDNLFKCKSLNDVLVKSDRDNLLTRDVQMLWGKLVSQYMQAMWFLLHEYIELQGTLSLGILKDELVHHIWTDACEALDIGGRGMLIPVMSVIQQVICQFKFKLNESLERFMEMCWSGIFELRKSDLFWAALEKFVKMTFQEPLLKEAALQKMILKYAQDLFLQGESVTGICNILLLQLQYAAKTGGSKIFDPFVNILVDAVLFGPVHRRDRKIDDETCAFIRSLGEKCCINEVTPFCSDTEVRGRAVQILLSFVNNATSSDLKTISKVVFRLIEKDSEISLRKVRYFADSYPHRYRHRIMQVLLLLESFLSEEDTSTLKTYIQNSLLNENHQPSIRYLQEWLLVRLFLRNSISRSDIWPMLQLASDTRPGSLCSFISITYHVAHALPKNDLESFMDNAMKEILPFTMTQHFNVRLYAQIAFIKLNEYAESIKLFDITTKYLIVYSSIKKLLASSCVAKNLKKVEEFYFSTFHALEHFSLQTIFYDLPRLTNVTHEEWISHDVLRLCGNEDSCIPLLSKNSNLQTESITCSVKSDLVGGDNDEISNHDVMNIQKKIIPWRAMFPDPETSETILLRKQSISEAGLIVVASLIDRPPNLGGLCRTCEAFGVFQYVLGNIKYLEDKQFQVLSVTSEQWVSIIEVKPNNLGDYLKSMKHEGYKVIGAEQTANSQALHEVKFPKKTVMLLGNEKEGIPVNLLPLLDVCVEVPQQGVIRSLNVHVTGAIFIWEYARQHNFRLGC